MKKLFENIRNEAALPDAIYRELVAMLFAMQMPVLGMGVAYCCVGVLIAWQWHDLPVAIMTACAALVTAARIATIHLYGRATPTALNRIQVESWEERYAIGCYAFAFLLAALNVRALSYHYPLMHMVTVSLVFGFGAGIVARISLRPKICIIGLLIATVPTVIALALHAASRSDLPGHAEMFAVEALVMATITALSLETVRYLYAAVVGSVTVKHDLSHLARQDDLTGLPNRLRLRERFDESIVPVARAERPHLALHFLDLDGFKAINDLHGHPAGDALLRVVAERLKRMVRAEDTVARLGGDEFVVVQASISQRSEAEMLARRIIKQISAPYDIEGQQMRISVSVGIAVAPEQGLDFDKLAACADAALYRSKGGGKGQLHFCTAEDAAGALANVA